jgi:hypothetical protein
LVFHKKFNVLQRRKNKLDVAQAFFAVALFGSPPPPVTTTSIPLS